MRLSSCRSSLTDSVTCLLNGHTRGTIVAVDDHFGVTICSCAGRYQVGDVVKWEMLHANPGHALREDSTTIAHARITGPRIPVREVRAIARKDPKHGRLPLEPNCNWYPVLAD